MKNTLKLLFLDVGKFEPEVIARAIAKFPILVIHEEGRKNPFILDSKILVKESREVRKIVSPIVLEKSHDRKEKRTKKN